MDFAMLPPEINSARMYSGAGSGPMLAAAAAWDALAAQLHAVGRGYESVISELASGWAGPSATTMAAAALPYAAWMHTTAAQAEQTATQARAAATAYEAAFAMTVPPPVIATNRSQLMTLLTTNVMGQNTAAIAATEAHYAEMWTQDATAMYNYAGNAAAASTLTPFAEPPQTTNPAGSAGQAGAVAQAAASTGSHAQTAISQLLAVPNALQGLTSPTVGSASHLAAAYEALAVELFAAFVVDSIGTFGIDAIGTFVIDAAGAVIGAAEADLFPIAGLASWSSPVMAGMGQAASIGTLSVPQAWTVAAPSAIHHVGSALTPATAATGPAVAAIPFAEIAAAGMAGRATAMAGRGRRRARATTQRHPKSPHKSPPKNGSIKGMTAKLRELARLRDAGVLTEENFIEQKRRLLGR